MHVSEINVSKWSDRVMCWSERLKGHEQSCSCNIIDQDLFWATNIYAGTIKSIRANVFLGFLVPFLFVVGNFLWSWKRLAKRPALNIKLVQVPAHNAILRIQAWGRGGSDINLTSGSRITLNCWAFWSSGTHTAGSSSRSSKDSKWIQHFLNHLLWFISNIFISLKNPNSLRCAKASGKVSATADLWSQRLREDSEKKADCFGRSPCKNVETTYCYHYVSLILAWWCTKTSSKSLRIHSPKLIAGESEGGAEAVRLCNS